MIKKLYEDEDLIFCIKPSGVVAQDDETENCMPSLLKSQFNINNINTVHRLDLITGGVMVYAKTREMAALLSKKIQNNELTKEYLAVIHGNPENENGIYEDLLFRDASKNKSYVVKRMRKGVKSAKLEYNLLETYELENGDILSLLKIKLYTGRTHQIRVQFASRGTPLYGDSKYGGKDNGKTLGLWSNSLTINIGGNQIKISDNPPDIFPWKYFNAFNL